MGRKSAGLGGPTPLETASAHVIFLCIVKVHVLMPLTNAVDGPLHSINAVDTPLHYINAVDTPLHPLMQLIHPCIH